ncbi:hypothetical protein K0U00_38810, partial [Paenibacillus sepulcri]|nr:hypothetical protein [Paenibacillus sepulcri]
MMNFILDNKWFILLMLEVLAWASTFFMVFARYRLGSKPLFRIGAILTVLTGVLPQVTLGIVNFIVEKKLDLFTFVIVLLILYGSTLGRKKIKQLDDWAKRKF